jgi:virulence-associated protein VagC
MMGKVKLIVRGSAQIVNIPKEFEFGGNKVLIRKSGDEVILSPYTEKKTKRKKG